VTKVVDLKSLPALAGWVIPPLAAGPLHVTRQRVFQMIEEGKIKSAVRVPGVGDRPAAYLIRIVEIVKLATENCPECRKITSDTGTAPEFCRHCDFGDQDIIYPEAADPEPVAHAVPHELAETTAQ